MTNLDTATYRCAELGAHLGPWLTAPSPLDPRALLDCLRAAEADTTGKTRDLWGCSALNWEAALNADQGSHPSANELQAVALEYAQLASTPDAGTSA